MRRSIVGHKSIVWMFFLVSVCFLGLIGRLWVLQIIKGEEYRRQSDLNRLETVFLAPPRGPIQDRKGRLLVSNRPAYNLVVTSESVKDFEQMWRILAGILEVSESELKKRFERGKQYHRRYEPIVLQRDISREIVARIATERFRLPGVRIDSVPAREALYANLAAHVLGYTREIADEQLRAQEFASYRVGDIVGKFGLERAWEAYLRGTRGKQRVVVNAAGWRVGELGSEPVIIGNTLEVTLDLDLQRTAEEALTGKRGAVVALNANSGEILAIAVSPSFDPNLFSGEMAAKDWAYLNSEKRLMNRAIQGGYPPGSIFKPLVAAGALESGVMQPKDRVHCPGYYWFGGRAYRCWRKEGHGSVDLHAALRSSCDVYFYVLGQRMGIDRIAEIASAFGLGQIANVGLSEESAGLMPSRDWKKTAFRRKQDQVWFPGETLSVVIGQGAVMVTPLQMARAYAALVNGGNLVTPRLVRRLISRDGHLVMDLTQPQVVGQLPVSGENLERVRKALVAVVNEGGGTGAQARLDPKLQIRVGGKTGTAQVVGLKTAEGRKGFEDHAWFVGFAPDESPEIVVAALIENGGHGGSAAAPVVGDVLEEYFLNSK